MKLSNFVCWISVCQLHPDSSPTNLWWMVGICLFLQSLTNSFAWRLGWGETNLSKMVNSVANMTPLRKTTNWTSKAFTAITPWFFPNSFSHGVLANIGSGAVPGRLPNHGFREGSGPGSGRFRGRFWAGFQGGSGRVPGHCFRNRVQERFWARFQEGSGWVQGGPRQGSRRDGSRTYWTRSGCGQGDRVPERFPWWTSSSSTSTSTSAERCNPART